MMKTMKKHLTVLLVAFVLTIAAAPITSMASNSDGSLSESKSQRYNLLNSDEWVVGYEIQNDNSSFAINAGMTTTFYDKNDQILGSESAFVPVLDAGESAFLFVVNPYGSSTDVHGSCFSHGSLEDATSIFGSKEVSAADYIDYDVDISNGTLSMKVTNKSSSYTIYTPTLTLLLKDASGDVNTIYSAMVAESNGRLTPGEIVNVEVDCPKGYEVYKVYKTGSLE